jgi:hypothetical protein
MKRVLHTILLGLFLSIQLSTLSAQIRDNESSANALAIQCAVSSGFSAEDYEEYCRRLAKTIGMLSSAQQTRVFGYLPMAGSGGAESVEAPVESETLTSAPKVGSTETIGVVAGSSVPAPIGTTGTVPGSTTTGGTPAKSGTSTWDALIQWFRQAQSAYESGTLSSFLKDNQS